MNTSPDEERLALWLDDELTGEELAAFEAGPGALPEHQAAREEVRRHRQMMAAAIPAAEEPPFAAVFNRQILRTIEGETKEPEVATILRPRWSFLWMPLAACAGMVFAFYLGARSAQRPAAPDIVVDGAPRAIPVEAYVYTPDMGVEAEWFTNPGSSSMVIVLNGVEAIPDAVDFSKTASISLPREAEAMAWLGPWNMGGLQ